MAGSTPGAPPPAPAFSAARCSSSIRKPAPRYERSRRICPAWARSTVDPLSGDLFFTGQCFGAGADDARLLRIGNPGSATPVLSTYVTLPGTPNGADRRSRRMARCSSRHVPRGDAAGVRVSGTNQPQPPTITPVPGHPIVLGERGRSVGQRSAQVADRQHERPEAPARRHHDRTPDVYGSLTTGASTGSPVPDGCLYISNGESRLPVDGNAGGTCGFATHRRRRPRSRCRRSRNTRSHAGHATHVTAQLMGVAPCRRGRRRLPCDGANHSQRSFARMRTAKATFTYTRPVQRAPITRGYGPHRDTTPGSNRGPLAWTAGEHSHLRVSLNASALEGAVVRRRRAVRARCSISRRCRWRRRRAIIALRGGGQSCNATTDATRLASCR